MIKDLQQKLAEFAAERDWDQFHSPKNLSMALIVEAAELVEHFQWLTTEESESIDYEKLQAVKEELADVFLYLLRLSDLLEIDIVAAANDKIQKNEIKYPVDLVKGRSKKYTEY